MEMTENQIAWARKHDWFKFATLDNKVICRDVICDRQGNWHEKDVVFEDYRELREWAGY
jgi:hypothetical protein